MKKMKWPTFRQVKIISMVVFLNAIILLSMIFTEGDYSPLVVLGIINIYTLLNISLYYKQKRRQKYAVSTEAS